MSAAPDDDARQRAEQRTLLMPRQSAGPQGDALPRGHAVQEFVVEQVLGVGRDSIVYLARDTKLDRPVALKEYLPSTIAMRVAGGEVAPRLPRFAPVMEQGLQSFIGEARLLGSFDHPALVKVYRFWAQNGTAYMAMPYYRGVTLKRWLADLGAPPSERWLRELLRPLAQALAALHERGTLHRDVAPENILLLHDKGAASYLEQPPRPVLLDFGAARRVSAEATQQLTAILKSGYSPVEQYANDDTLRQGPWTDVYALCAVVYAAVTGKPPPAAVARAVRDELVPARQAGRGRYGEPFLAAIDAGLAVRPEARPADMPSLLARLDAPAAVVVDLPLEPSRSGETRERAATAAQQAPRRARAAPLAVGALALALVAVAAWWLLAGPGR